MYGPSVNLMIFDKWYTGLSYYWGSGFDYTIIESFESTGQNIEYNYDGEKADLDIWVGYRFHPRASVFLGYKSAKLKRDVDVLVFSFKDDLTTSGPVVGVNGNYPVMDSGFILFGTFGYAFLDVENEFENLGYDENGELEIQNHKITFKARGPAIECGVSYMFQNIPQLSLSGGYKYQYYEDIDDSDSYLSFSGLTFGANYRF